MSKQKSPRSFLVATLTWVFILLVLYFSSDIIHKGVVLNDMLPYPILGTAMWIILIGLIWWLFIKPILEFCRLKSSSNRSLDFRIKRILKRLKHLQTAEKTTPGCVEYANLSIAYQDKVPSISEQQREHQAKLENLLAELERFCPTKTDAEKLILRYSQSAGIAIAFSRNNMLDGIIMMALQIKLVIALAKLYGFKPSPVFNSLCLGWVVANSFVAMLLQNFTEQVGDRFGEIVSDMFVSGDEGSFIAADAVGTKFCSTTVSLILEAIMSGTAVFVTGHIFLLKLEGDNRKIGLKDYLAFRRKGRVALGKELIVSLPSKLAKKALLSINPFKKNANENV